VAAGVAAEEAPPHAAEARLTDGVPRRLRQVDGVEVRRPLRPVDGAGAEVRLRRLEAGAEAQRRLLGEEPTALPVAAPVAALVAAGERPHQARMEGIQGGRALNNVFASSAPHSVCGLGPGKTYCTYSCMAVNSTLPAWMYGVVVCAKTSQ